MDLAAPNNAITKAGPLHGHCVGPLAHTVGCEQQWHTCVGLRAESCQRCEAVCFIARKKSIRTPKGEGSLQTTASHYSLPFCLFWGEFSPFLILLFDVPLLLPFSFVSNGPLSIFFYRHIFSLIYFFPLSFSFCFIS